MKKCTLLLTALSLFMIVHSQSWNLLGNAGTNSKINFLGTTDDNPLLIRIKNQFSGEIDSVYALTFLGFRAGGHTSGANNTAMGFKSMYANTSGTLNAAIGSYALYSNTTGGYNNASGAYALYANTTGNSNTANGAYSLYSNINGIYNVGNGAYTLENNTSGNYNTADGLEAMYNNTTGSGNTAVGMNSLYGNTTGSGNTTVGYATLGNGIGNYNTAMGYGAMSYAYGSLSSFNTGIGYNALGNTTNSQYNTAIGYNAGSHYDNGYNNAFLGANCDVNGPGYYNCIAIGQAVICTASSQAKIGNSATNSIGGYANWTNFSDGRYKKDVTENVKGLDFILKLRPVTYHLDVSGISKKLDEGHSKDVDDYTKKAIAEKEKILFSGFVAQEVEQAAKETNYDFSGVDKPKNANDFYGLRYSDFVVPLVKAVQELSTENTDLKKQVEDLQERMKRLESSFVTKK